MKTRLGWLILICCGLAEAVEPPPGTPVPPGVHPRLTLTAGELAAAHTRAADDHVVWLKLNTLVRDAEGAFEPPVGELPPYDSGDNRALILRAVRLGYGAVIAERADLARRAAEILLLYADGYLTREPNPEGRVYRYSLSEAMWLCEAAVAADLVFAAKVLTEAERTHIVDDLLRPAAVNVLTDTRSTPEHKEGHHQCYNFQAWHCSAVGLVGFLLGDQKLIDWAIDGEYGFKHMVSHDIRDDGLFWERSVGYHSFVMNAASRLCEAAIRSGVDLWNLAVPDDLVEDEWGSGNYMVDGDNGPKTFAMMFEAPFDYVFPNLVGPGIGDSSDLTLAGIAAYLELAYARTGRQRLAEALGAIAARQVLAPPGWRTWSPEGAPAFSTYLADGRCVFVIENTATADRGCWVSPTVPLAGPGEATVRLRYRTVDCTAAEPVKVRVVVYHAGRSMGEDFTMIPLEPSAEWRLAEGLAKVPEGADAIGLEPFLWKAAGRVDMTDFEIVGPSGRTILDPEDLTAMSDRPWSNTLPWNMPVTIPTPPPPPRDAGFGTNGRRQGGSSLFPSSGFAILRERWDDPKGLAMLLSYGPYGGGHGHPDMLTMVLYGRERMLLPSLGTVTYDSPLHASWSNQTVAHDTVVVDRTTQWPRSKWGHDTADRKVNGRLLAFFADQRLRIARARSDNAYDGMVLDRTVALLDGLAVDIFQVGSADGSEHTYDFVLHCPEPFEPLGRDLEPGGSVGEQDGYEHLTEVRRCVVDDQLRGRFGALLRATVAAGGATELIVAEGVGRNAASRMPLLLLRRHATRTVYAVVYQAADDQREVRIDAAGERVRVTVGGGEWVLDLGPPDGVRVTAGQEDWRVGPEGLR